MPCSQSGFFRILFHTGIVLDPAEAAAAPLPAARCGVAACPNRAQELQRGLCAHQERGAGTSTPSTARGSGVGAGAGLRAAVRAVRGGSVRWAPAALCVGFSKEKTATGQTLDPNSNLYLEVSFKKTKENAKCLTQSTGVRSLLQRAGGRAGTP